MSSAVNDLIYLLSCSVNSIVPDKKRLEQIDMDKLYQFSKMHTLRASVYVV